MKDLLKWFINVVAGLLLWPAIVFSCVGDYTGESAKTPAGCGWLIAGLLINAYYLYRVYEVVCALIGG